MKIKTSELTGAALDWAVAKCDGKEMRAWRTYKRLNRVNYSTDWAQGGLIIEREKLGWFWDSGNEHWCAATPKATFCEDGPTPLIAAMRCYVASKLGDEIEVPEDLK